MVNERRLGCEPGQIDLRFCGWRINLCLFINPHASAVFRLADAAGEAYYYLLCLGAWPLPTKESWVISRLSYRVDGVLDQYVIEDCVNGQRVVCGGFRLSETFNVVEFVSNAEHSWPAALYASQGDFALNRGMPRPEELDAFFDKLAFTADDSTDLKSPND